MDEFHSAEVYQRESKINKIILNSANVINKFNSERFINLLMMMNKLPIGASDKSKLWFFKMNSFMKQDHLRLYALKLEVIYKNLSISSLKKLPDPKEFAIGLNFIPQKSETKKKSSNFLKIKQKSIF